MKHSLRLLLASVSAFVLACNGTPGVAAAAPKHVGLQLWSLRADFAKDVPGTLALVHKFGVKDVELAGTYGRTPEQFKTELASAGLTPVSGHFPYERWQKEPEAVTQEAVALGLKYAGCAWIPHKEPFDEATCREACAVFNQAGEALAKHGIRFFYHSHGYEFQPHGSETLFDMLVTQTHPKFVSFQMDVFWVVHAGQDPVKLLKKHGARWELMHLKGMKAGTPTGLLTGSSDVTNDVPVGTGQIDYLPILHAARKAGVKWFFIEDESPSSKEQIPESLRFLERAKW